MLVHVNPVQDHLGIGLLIAIDCIEISGLTCTGAAKQQDHMPLRNGHVNVPQQDLFFKEIPYGAIL